MSHETLSGASGEAEPVNLWVRITRQDVSCCGVIKAGWEGRVAYVLGTSQMDDRFHGDIIILDDGTLVWDYQCEQIDPPRMN